MDSGRRMPVPEIQERSCSHKMRVGSHREHNGLATILNFNNFSFKYKILFSIFHWNERSDDSIVTCLGNIQTFAQSTLFSLNILFKDLCTVGGFTVFFRSI